jgi:hypothetical protein
LRRLGRDSGSGEQGACSFREFMFCAADFMRPNNMKARTNDLCNYGAETLVFNACMYFPTVSGMREARGRLVRRVGAAGRESNAIYLVEIA